MTNELRNRRTIEIKRCKDKGYTLIRFNPNGKPIFQLRLEDEDLKRLFNHLKSKLNRNRKYEAGRYSY